MLRAIAAVSFGLAALSMGACATPASPAAMAGPRALEPGTAAERRTAAYFDSISADPVSALMFLRQMPKGGDLHSHLSGAVYAETFLRWAAEDGACIELPSGMLVRPPCDAPGRVAAATALDDGALYGDVIDAWSMRNWHPAKEQNGHDQFFDTFGKFTLVSGSARTADMLTEVARRAADGRVSYLELMVTPSGTGATALGRATGLDADLVRTRDRLVQAGLRDSVARASRRMDAAFARQRESLGCSGDEGSPGCAVEVRVLYQILRASPPEQVFAHLVAAFEMATSDPRVVGFNMVQPEDDMVAMRDFAQQMRMIQALRPLYPGVRFTLHAGELAAGLVPPEGLRFHIRESVRVAGASRIGHGVDIAHEDSPYHCCRRWRAARCSSRSHSPAMPASSEWKGRSTRCVCTCSTASPWRSRPMTRVCRART